MAFLSLWGRECFYIIKSDQQERRRFMESITVRPVALNFAPERAELETFLAAHHLKLEADVERAFGLYDDGDVLRGLPYLRWKVSRPWKL